MPSQSSPPQTEQPQMLVKFSWLCLPEEPLENRGSLLMIPTPYKPTILSWRVPDSQHGRAWEPPPEITTSNSPSQSRVTLECLQGDPEGLLQCSITFAAKTFFPHVEVELSLFHFVHPEQGQKQGAVRISPLGHCDSVPATGLLCCIHSGEDYCCLSRAARERNDYGDHFFPLTRGKQMIEIVHHCLVES